VEEDVGVRFDVCNVTLQQVRAVSARCCAPIALF
jgi:hypothetical protein